MATLKRVWAAYEEVAGRFEQADGFAVVVQGAVKVARVAVDVAELAMLQAARLWTAFQGVSVQGLLVEVLRPR